MKISPYYRTDRELVVIRITHKKVNSFIFTDVHIMPKYWNPKARQVRSSHGNAVALNNKIAEMIDQVQAIWNAGRFESSKELKAHIDKNGLSVAGLDQSLYSTYAKKQMEGRSYYDKRIHENAIKWVNKFSPDVKLNNWTIEFVEEFERFLKKQGLTTTTVEANLKRCRTILNIALRHGLINYNQNPFKLGFSIKSGKPNDIKLNLQELSQVWNARNDLSFYQKQAAQTFLLQVLCDGARIRDVLLLKRAGLKSGYIAFEASKTKKRKVIPIADKIAVLLEEIPDTGEYLLPYLNAGFKDIEKTIQSATARINKQLKNVTETLQIAKAISTHSARHTFAYVNAESRQMDILELQQALGHAKIQTTKDYIGRLSDDGLTEKRKGFRDLF